MSKSGSQQQAEAKSAPSTAPPESSPAREPLEGLAPGDDS